MQSLRSEFYRPERTTTPGTTSTTASRGSSPAATAITSIIRSQPRIGIEARNERRRRQRQPRPPLPLQPRQRKRRTRPRPACQNILRKRVLRRRPGRSCCPNFRPRDPRPWRRRQCRRRRLRHNDGPVTVYSPVQASRAGQIGVPGATACHGRGDDTTIDALPRLKRVGFGGG